MGATGSAGPEGPQGPPGPNQLDGSTSIVGAIAFPADVSVAGTLQASDSGGGSVGVLGTGATGVRGEATTSTGTGVYGEGSALGSGVHGHNANSLGTAVLGVAEGAAGPSYGVSGQNLASQGTGTYGLAAFGSGTTYGVRGEAFSPGGFGVFSSGNFGGTGAKYFVQPHPTDPSREIRYVALEGNEAGTYFRGSARLEDGVAVVAVPEDFRLVTQGDGLTVHLTPVGGWSPLWVESKSLEAVVVRGEGDLDFDYEVRGVRRGYADVEIVAENQAYRPLYRGVPFGTQYPPEIRRILVESGVLHDDLTPNEETAAALGWELLEPERAPWHRAAAEIGAAEIGAAEGSR